MTLSLRCILQWLKLLVQFANYIRGASSYEAPLLVLSQLMFNRDNEILLSHTSYGHGLAYAELRQSL